MKTLEKDYLPRKEYEKQEKVFQGKNSYAKTDPDATFMRMKEDHMRNGQLKPGYNVQIGTEGQFVVGYSLHQRPGDPTADPPPGEGQGTIGKLPKRVIGDAGYGSEENYTYLERKGVEGYLKYNTFDQEQKRSWRKKRFRVENFPYDPSRDESLVLNRRYSPISVPNPYAPTTGLRPRFDNMPVPIVKAVPGKGNAPVLPGNRWTKVNPRLIHYRNVAWKVCPPLGKNSFRTIYRCGTCLWALETQLGVPRFTSKDLKR